MAKGASKEDLLEAAEKLRAARVREVRARKAQVIPANAARAAECASLDQEIEDIQNLPVESILAECRGESMRTAPVSRLPLFGGE
jgi:hypothetical protein